MAQLILIRHSITQPDDTLNSHEWALSAEGIEKSKQLAELLRPYAISKLYSSKENKAIETGKIIAEALGIAHGTAKDLAETQRKGLDFVSSPAEFKAQVRAAMNAPDELLFGEETFNEARVRFLAEMERLIGLHVNETIALVSHGRVLAMALAYLTGRNPVEIWDVLKMPAYIVLNLPDKSVLKWVNDIAEEV